VRALCRSGLVVAFCALAACNGVADEAEQPTTLPPGPVGISVTDPWCAELGNDEVACYMTLTAALEGDALVEVRVPEQLARQARLEVPTDGASVATLPDGEVVTGEPTETNEVDERREVVERLEIPPQETVQLQPSGYKVVISGFSIDPSFGQEIEMVLVFERAGDFVVVTDVRET
jgi:copper(I)-binding protein